MLISIVFSSSRQVPDNTHESEHRNDQQSIGFYSVR